MLARPLPGCVNAATDPKATLQNIGQLSTNKSTGVSDANELQVSVDRPVPRLIHILSIRGLTVDSPILTLAGWQSNTIVTFQSGTPFTLYSKAGSDRETGWNA